MKNMSLQGKHLLHNSDVGKDTVIDKPRRT